jgi:hypothetical protein
LLLRDEEKMAQPVRACSVYLSSLSVIETKKIDSVFAKNKEIVKNQGNACNTSFSL